ncbi:GNAT family N-acetyltransferase [Oceanobacillus kapialis]|uniref:GNAT family N-acetyltransferase n=1 Tax=Oceanobacillus kapialis TaxID=481353 RepID=A0ABW5Q475_9BACI
MLLVRLADKTNVISDFFIMRKFRRQGIGKQVAHRLFEKHKGVWEVKQTNENTPAYAFWKKVISEVAKESFYQEEILEGDLWDGAVLVFQYNNKKTLDASLIEEENTVHFFIS